MNNFLVDPKLSAKFLPFEEARVFARSLNLATENEWRVFSKNGKIPHNIPKNPAAFYKKTNQWRGWPDWLGTAFLPFEEARLFARSLNLATQKEWNVYSKSGKRPHNIPSNPQKEYLHDGFKDWPDWLGLKKVNRWTQITLLSFFKETILPIIDTLDDATLQLIIIHSGCNYAIKQLAKDNPLRKLLDAKANNDLEALNQFKEETKNYTINDDTVFEDDHEEYENTVLEVKQTFENINKNLPTLTSHGIIQNLKNLENGIGIDTSDAELAEFLQCNALHNLWSIICNSPNPDVEIQTILNA